MKRLSILLFFIALMMPPCHEPGTSMAQQCSENQVARLTLPMVGGSVPASGLVAAWHYPSGKGASNFTTGDGAGDQGVYLGAIVVISSNGNVTKLSMKGTDHGGASNVRICMYALNGSSLVCGTGAMVFPGNNTVQWHDFDVSSTAISAGSYLVLWQTDSSGPEGYGDAGTGQLISSTWGTGACDASVTPAPYETLIWGVRAYVE